MATTGRVALARVRTVELLPFAISLSVAASVWAWPVVWLAIHAVSNAEPDFAETEASVAFCWAFGLPGRLTPSVLAADVSFASFAVWSLMNMAPRSRTFCVDAFACAALPAAISVRLLWCAATIHALSCTLGAEAAATVVGAAEAAAGRARAAPSAIPADSAARRTSCMVVSPVDAWRCLLGSLGPARRRDQAVLPNRWRVNLPISQACADAASGYCRDQDVAHRGGDQTGTDRDGDQSKGQDAMANQRPGNQTANTPDLSETELREMKIDDLRERARDEGVQGASSLRKEELVKAVSRAHREGTAGDESADSQQQDADGDAGAPGDAGPDGGRIRRGSESSKSLKYSQEVTSPDDEPERAGRSLATTSHEVIRQWAEARGGRPATVEGTEHGDRLGVLRFDFGDDTPKLRQVSWDEWFRTFDERRLNFLYQEEPSDGRQSTFFRLENPEREDA